MPEQLVSATQQTATMKAASFPERELAGTVVISMSTCATLGFVSTMR
ncbi:MAG TPA: hypothetical protein VK509_07670 [Polyangiales bacterium]|nr:hypothetical protein [Polyangiales bacterium]